MIVWKIALRNLREHKTKTVIVGILIAVAMTVLVAGNSVMDSITAQLEASYRDSYTGDVVVHGESEYNLSLFGVQGLDRLNASVPTLRDYEAVTGLLAETRAEQWTGIVLAQGLVLHDEEQAGVATLWGIEPDAYLAMFASGIELVTGSPFSAGEPGILLNESLVETIEQSTGVTYGPGDTIRISANSTAGGARIRQVPVSGVFRFTQRNPQLSMVSLLDLGTARELAGLDVAEITREDLDASEQELLGSVSEEDLFGGSFIEEPGAPSTSPLDVESVLGEAETIDEASPFDLDEWHFVIARAPSSRSAGALLREVRNGLESIDDTEAGDWQWAAGATVTLVVALQIVFNAVAVIISIVSVIIIVNTLVISISERIPELGTIRAIGGKRRFVRRLITHETLVITGAFGIAGMVAGSLIVGAVALAGIEADSTFLQLLLGGEIFRPSISASAIVSSLAGVGLMAWIASLYPVHVATSISPVAAMQRG